WIGFALAAIFDVLQATRRRQYARSCAIFGCATSLMLLAGDPQSVANTFIVASVVFAAEFVQRLSAGPAIAVADIGSRSCQTLDDPSGVESLATSATSGSFDTKLSKAGPQDRCFRLVAQCRLL